MSVEPESAAAAEQDYLPEAELFAVQRHGRKRDLFYRRFDTAAEAIKFAVEEMPADSASLILETEFSRFDAEGIAALYAAEAFPLARRAAAP